MVTRLNLAGLLEKGKGRNWFHAT